MRKALVFSAAAAAGTAACFVGELYRYTFCRSGSPLLSVFLDKKGHEQAYYDARDRAAQKLRSLSRERMEIQSPRGERLVGYFYPGAGSRKRIAFLVHGYRSEHTETAGLYRDLYQSLGFDLFCCDHCAHGESGGCMIGFDRFESADCLLWIEELKRRFGEDIEILLHGFSMGAATVMKMSDACPAQVKAVIEDCGYASGEEQLRRSFGHLYPLMRALNRLIASYDLKDTDVRPSLARSSLPILFIHGRLDSSVPFSNAPALYDFYQGRKDYLYIDDARHMECFYRAPQAYRNKLTAFILPSFEFPGK